ncbi:MAG: 2-iminoacetate synthase ThiH [Candidatus Nanoarchaeia archaeon]
MSFIRSLIEYEKFDFESFFLRVKDSDIERVIHKAKLSELDFLALLSPCAEKYLAQISIKAVKLTQKHFGRTISIYAPLYLSNYCINDCVYCGFRKNAKIKRHALSEEELHGEAKYLFDSGIRDILVLTGESRAESPVEYISDCISILSSKFPSILIEVYPMECDGYQKLNTAGADGLTLHQETYDRNLYANYHKNSSKSDYEFRREAPERALQAGMRFVNVGALLGLCEFRKDIFFAGLHADYLSRNYPDIEIGLGIPRISSQNNYFNPPFTVSNKNLIQSVLALRLFIPFASISISTRECPEFRDLLVELGITRLSAGSKTEIGGYSSSPKTEAQFRIHDNRSVSEIVDMLKSKNYDPVFINWRKI